MADSKPFNLTRWFSLLSLACIASISAVLALLISNFLTDKILHRDAELTMEFVQSVVLADRASAYFLGEKSGAGDPELEAVFKQLSRMPDVLRANVYTRERSIIWSSDKELIGKRFGANDDLDKALAGELEFDSGEVRKEEHVGVQHPFSEKGVTFFVENYVPVWDDARRNVIGAVELYRTPQALSEAIAAGERLIWVSAALGGLFLYAALYWIVRRADNVMREQRRRLVEVETFAVVGEMASAVAHGIRNPLAAIRSSAELALEDKSGAWREQATDIIDEVDRVERWLRELLRYSRPVPGGIETVDINPTIRKSLGDFERETGRREIDVATDLDEIVPAVRGDASLLGQVLNSLIANALDAMEGQQGQLKLSSRFSADRRYVEVSISDSGTGIEAEDLNKVFKPFYTTKTKGLGLGLPLAKRIVERHGGALAMASTAGAGTTVTLKLAVA